MKEIVGQILKGCARDGIEANNWQKFKKEWRVKWEHKKEGYRNRKPRNTTCLYVLAVIMRPAAHYQVISTKAYPFCLRRVNNPNATPDKGTETPPAIS